MTIKYVGDESTGTPFTVGETRTVVVTSEVNDPISGYDGDAISYTATVLDSESDKLPAAFEASLKLWLAGSPADFEYEVITDQVFDAGHYSQSTGLLTLSWTVPAVGDWDHFEACTTILEWITQYI